MKKLLWLSVIVFTFFAQQSCNSNGADGQKPKDSAAAVASADKSPIDQQLSAFARYISGVHDDQNDSLEQSEFWKLHAAKTDLRWRLLMQNVGTPIATWVGEKNYLPANAPKTLLYPFAGGDFYYANLFYPNRDTVIMIGLEPVGSVFDAKAVESTKLEDYLTTLDRCMFYPHKLGFFRTLSMDDDFSHEFMNGTLHTFMFYLARNGFDLHYVEYFNLDDQGNPIAVEAGAEAKGLKIGYSNKSDKQVRQLVYISQDISNTYVLTIRADGQVTVNSHKISPWSTGAVPTLPRLNRCLDRTVIELTQPKQFRSTKFVAFLGGDRARRLSCRATAMPPIFSSDSKFDFAQKSQLPSTRTH
ncbi:MAG: hypothetical protein RIS50_1885 [Bacteroidota bacterium]